MTDTPIDQDLTQRVQEFLEALSELSQRTGIMITGLRIYAATNRRTLQSAAAPNRTPVARARGVHRRPDTRQWRAQCAGSERARFRMPEL